MDPHQLSATIEVIDQQEKLLGYGRFRTNQAGEPVVDVPAKLAARVAPSTAVGDPADLLDVDMDQVARSIVFVASDRLTGGTVDVGEPVDPTADQDRVHRRGRHPEPVADLDRTQALLPTQGTIWRTTGAGVLLG